jgi:hypothetical protein
VNCAGNPPVGGTLDVVPLLGAPVGLLYTPVPTMYVAREADDGMAAGPEDCAGWYTGAELETFAGVP